jgi:hypothetical protein
MMSLEKEKKIENSGEMLLFYVSLFWKFQLSIVLGDKTMEM